MPDIRTLKRRLHQIQHQPQKIIKKSEAGNRLLKVAKMQYEERRNDTNRNIYDCSYEAAGDLINLSRGRIISLGGFGSGYRLGAGKWRYMNGKWTKKE